MSPRIKNNTQQLKANEADRRIAKVQPTIASTSISTENPTSRSGKRKAPPIVLSENPNPNPNIHHSLPLPTQAPST
jgi:hypothetical protein